MVQYEKNLVVEGLNGFKGFFFEIDLGKSRLTLQGVKTSKSDKNCWDYRFNISENPTTQQFEL